MLTQQLSENWREWPLPEKVQYLERLQETSEQTGPIDWPAGHVVGPDEQTPVPFHLGQRWAHDSDRRITAMLAGTQGGKALAIDTPIPTPNGFALLRDLEIGDKVFDETGHVCQVTYATPIMLGHYCYRVVFDDGCSLIADAGHRWKTQTYNQRKNAARHIKKANNEWVAHRPQCQRRPIYSVITTEEIASTLHDRRGALNHSIAIPCPPMYPERDLLIPPYTLGAWLGDGSSNGAEIHCADVGIIEEIAAEGIPVSEGRRRPRQGKALTYYLGYAGSARDKATGRFCCNASLKSKLVQLELINNKHLPISYLTASIAQRRALLQGLMDTDGHCSERGKCEFTTTNEYLADGALELIRSLGIKARLYRGRATLCGKDCGPKYRIAFTTDVKVFRLARKLARQKKPGTCRPDTKNRYITNVIPVESIPVRCIQVDSLSHLYLAGINYIPTHNTGFGPWWLANEIERLGAGDYLAVTATYDLFKLKMLPALLQVFDTILGIGRYWAGDRIIELRNPKTGQFQARRSTDPMWGRIILRSADAEGGLESATAKAAWLDEAGQPRFALAAWRGIQRRIALHQGRVLVTTTLYDLGWIKSEFIDPAKADGETELITLDSGAEVERTDSTSADVCLVQFDSIANPTYPLAEYERAKRTMPPDEFAMFWRGRAAKLRTLIYDCFDSQVHVIPPRPIPANWPRVGGIDPLGERIAAVWLAFDPEKRQLHVYREYLEPFGATTGGHARAMLHESRHERIAQWVGGGPSERQARADWTGAGLLLQEPPFGDVWVGIGRVYALFKENGLLIHANCENLRAELGSYQRQRDRAGELTNKIRDKEKYHLCDALRYAAAWVTEPRERQQLVYAPVRIGPEW